MARKSKKGLTEDMSIDDMAQAIIEHTGLAMDDIKSYMADETVMRSFYEQAMQGEPVPSTFEERKPEPMPLLDDKGKKIRKKPAKSPAERHKKDPPVHKEAGFLTLSTGRKVNLLHVVADKTDQGYNKGRNNLIVVNPDLTDQSYNVVFEMWPDITEEFPVSIIEDYRLRAHVLFEVVQVQVGPKTTGKFKNKIVNRKGYTILSPAVSESEVKMMHSYLLDLLSEEEELASLASRMIGGE